MRKMLLAAALLVIGAAIAPAAADPGHGCQIIGGETDAQGSCTYTATGPATYVAATPNNWTITVVRGQETITLVSEESAQPPSSGAVATAAGDVVTVRMGPDCVPATPVCGWIGLLVVTETE